jgi:protein-tyrosine phosphatase
LKTKVLKIDPHRPDAEIIRVAGDAIRRGELVGFPTETVYGLACRVERGSLARLDRLKGRDASKHYTLHIGQIEEYRKYVPKVGVRAEKLIRQAWPGPLTLVFEVGTAEVDLHRSRLDGEMTQILYKDNSIGIRCPDHPVASLLLRLVDHPVVAPSANYAGQPPATDADQVVSQLADGVDMILDSGPCKHKKSSTVALVGRGGIEMLREGVYSPLELQTMSKVVFLFVCTGNTCRSPMAEGFFRKYLAEKISSSCAASIAAFLVTIIPPYGGPNYVANSTFCLIGGHNTNIMLTCQVLFHTTALLFVARAGCSTAISTMSLSVVFSRWDLFSFRGT